MSAPKLSSTRKQALDDFISKTVAEGGTPGFAVGVTSLDEELYVSAGGYKTFNDPASGPVGRDSVFWLCSFTKLITTIAALQLIERGLLSLSDPVSKYIPQFANPVILEGTLSKDTSRLRAHRPCQTVVAVAHLLSQSSGLAYFTSVPNPPFSLAYAYTFKQGPTGEETQEEFLRLIQEGYPGIPLQFEPGTSFAYGYSSDILGIVIERISGQSLAEYSEKHIFIPLGIRTTFQLTAELKERLVDLAFRKRDRTIVPFQDQTRLPQRYPDEVHLALGGLGGYSTVPDFLSLLRHLLRINAGKETSNPVLKRESVKSLFQPQLGEAGSTAVGALVRLLDPGSQSDSVNWSTGLALTTKDWPGKRNAGSAFWCGWAGLWYIMDPTTGIALMTASQIVPRMDPVAMALLSKFEEIVYAHLES